MRIGVFDSGVGGLSVLREIHRHLPQFPTIYYADQAHLPYGERSPDDLRQLVESSVEFLIRHGAGVIVLACHTASAASLHELRSRHPDIPIVGMEPAVKPAAEQSQTGVIGVLTTHATASSALYQRVVDRYARHVRVVTQPAPDLVTIVENGTKDTPEAGKTMRRYLQPMNDAGADRVVLACTHFPFLADHLARLTDATLVDPSEAVARQVARILPANAEESNAPHLYYTSGAPDAFQRAIRLLIGYEVDVNP